MSYVYLPNYLKSCFLYMGVFEEDRRIRVSMLKKLWISEGFLKPSSGKCLETIAHEYFKELVDRNLILVDLLGSIGNVYYCKIHDLLRDLCLKEVEKESFYHVARDDPPANNSERRIVFPRKTAWLSTNEALGYLSHVRSIICDDIHGMREEDQLPYNLRLLRTLHAYEKDAEGGDYLLGNVFKLVNSRYLSVSLHENSKLPTSIDLLWNLYTLILSCSDYLIIPIEIWKLHQLRHLIFDDSSSGLILPNPPCGDNEIVIMEYLQTLKGVENLILNEDVVKRIPNVKKLNLSYDKKQMEGENCLRYLQCLSKLENLHSLKKLSIIASSDMVLEDIMPKIGSLPLLEKFVLSRGFFKTGKWETIEGQFPSLKFLKLDCCDGLEDWIVSDKSHFPVLQKLRLDYLYQLMEIPSEVGEIATLKSIELHFCSESAVESAKNIVDEQEDLYGDQLDLHIRALP